MYGMPMQGCGCGRSPFGLSQGAPGLGHLGMSGSNVLMGSQMAFMSSMMAMMMQLLQQLGMGGMGGQGGMLPAQAGFGGGGAGGGISDFLGGGGASGGAGAPAIGGGGPTSAAAGAGGASPVQIGQGTRVLEIGDSHTVGTFGQELDAKLRGTGAQVSTYASAGANPSDFVNGTGHKYGYWEKHADGSEKKVGYGTNAAPPNLEQLIAREKPQVILVNLGANFRGSGNPKAEVDKIGQIAKKHNIPLIWVGPPKTAQDNNNPSSIKAFDQKMAEAVAPYGKYIASSGFTPRYSGGDGIHYGGSEGTNIARQWANGVFNAITGR